jgi:CcmD family protein
LAGPQGKGGLEAKLVNKYLFAAYSLFWMFFFVYAWIIARRQSRLEGELKDLERKITEAPSNRT